MFTVGIEIDSRAYFMSSTMLISLPTGSKMFNWLCTYLNTYQIEFIHKSYPHMFLKMFLIMFTLGGSSGLILGNNVIDISLHDTYYVVSHFHIVLSLGTLFAIINGISYYQDHINILTSLINVLSLLYQNIFSIGIFLTFISLHYVSFPSQPRRISDFSDSINCWNFVSSLGCILTWVSFFVFVPVSTKRTVSNNLWHLTRLKTIVC